jgi:hypothetical protein
MTPLVQFLKQDSEEVRLEKLRRLAQAVVEAERERAPVLKEYTPIWTGASGDPVLNDGVLIGYYSKFGREVWATVALTIGASTTFGSGAWFFSLPFVPSTLIIFNGAARVLDVGTNVRTGVVQSLTDGTARCSVYIDSASAAISATNPMTWAATDRLNFSLRYVTQ